MITRPERYVWVYLISGEISMFLIEPAPYLTSLAGSPALSRFGCRRHERRSLGAAIRGASG